MGKIGTGKESRATFMSGADAATAHSSPKLWSAARSAGGSGAPSAKRRVRSPGRLGRRVIAATNIVPHRATRATQDSRERGGVQSLRLRSPTATLTVRSGHGYSETSRSLNRAAGSRSTAYVPAAIPARQQDAISGFARFALTTRAARSVNSGSHQRENVAYARRHNVGI